MDRRYRQTAGASDAGANRREALTRAKLAQARNIARSARSGGNERGPKSIDPMGAIPILRARSQASAERNQVFQEEGSGVYGATPSLRAARRMDDELPALLPGLG